MNKEAKTAIKWVMIFKYICVIATVLIIPLSIVVYNAIVTWRIDHTETGITRDGHLQIVYGREENGGYVKLRLSNYDVLEKTEDIDLYGLSPDGVEGSKYRAVSEGNVDIYAKFKYSHNEEYFTYRLYHVTVDSDLKISYTVEDISEERFEELTDKE